MAFLTEQYYYLFLMPSKPIQYSSATAKPNPAKKQLHTKAHTILANRHAKFALETARDRTQSLLPCVPTLQCRIRSRYAKLKAASTRMLRCVANQTQKMLRHSDAPVRSILAEKL